MERIIPAKNWEILRQQAMEWEQIRNSVGTCSREEAIRYKSIFSETVKRVQGEVGVCETAGNLFEHDGADSMQNVVSYLELLSDGLLNGKKVEGIIEKVRKSLLKIMITVSAMGFWAEKKDMRMSYVGLREVLGEIGGLLNEYKIEIEIDVDERLKASIHIETIQMLIINMVSNAKKRGGANKVKISAKEEGPFTVLEVSDNGHGVKQGVLPHIFEYGYSGERGTGMGLANGVERIAEMYGEISCEANGGMDNERGSNGAKFKMKLRDCNIGYFEYSLVMADKYFELLDESCKNSDILKKTLKIQGLTTHIVKRLEQEERECNWPLNDEDVKEFISTKCSENDIPLPKDEEARERWICLIYMASSNLEAFSCGNLVLEEDISGEGKVQDGG